MTKEDETVFGPEKRSWSKVLIASESHSHFVL